MKQTELIMGMPITVEIVDASANEETMKSVFDYFRSIDERFSVYKTTSEITKMNQGLLRAEDASEDMKTVLALCEETKQATAGYFDILARNGRLDPSGIVKGWAIFHASELLKKKGMKNYFVEAGGDIQVRGLNSQEKQWSIGIRNPFDISQIVKSVYLKDEGIATSGTYLRGQHVYNPHAKSQLITDIVSLTVIGPNIYEADRFATAAFAMGMSGIAFIEPLPGFEGYIIDKDGIATMTGGFESYTHPYVSID